MRLWDKIRGHANERPDAPALLDSGGTVLSYAQLVGRAREELKTLGQLPKGARVGILIEPRIESIVSFLALSATRACAPLNPALGSSDASEQRAQLSLSHLSLEPLEKTDIKGKTESIMLLLTTSGSTGLSKSVELTHQNILSATEALVHSLALTPKDRTLGVMPLFHIHGLSALFASLYSGGSFVLCDDKDYSRSLKTLGATWYTASPGLHQIILDALGTKPKHSLRFTRSASSAMPRTLQHQLEQCLGVPHLEAYGMTEASPLIASNAWAQGERREGSVGRARGTEIVIWDDQDQVLASGDSGRIVVRGPNVCQPGWLDTGDLGYLDSEGFLFVTGRVKSVINRGGEKISPLEVERALQGHPAVRRAACFPIPHKVLGEAVAAAITLESSLGLQVDDLQDIELGLRSYLGRRLAPFKIPQRIDFVDTLPLSESGKLKRSELLPSPTDEPSVLREIWQDFFPGREIGPKDNFFELGGHSILAAQLLNRVADKLHRELPLSAIFERPTFSGFSKLLQDGVHERPLSSAQQNLYFVDQRDGPSPRYAVTASLRLEGSFELEILQQSLDALRAKHPALRSVIQERDGQLVQKIVLQPDLKLPVETVSRQSLPRLMEDEYSASFDLHEGPLFRCRLLRLAPREHILLLTAHHIITDAWSTSVLREELATNYLRLTEGHALSLQSLGWSKVPHTETKSPAPKSWLKRLQDSPSLKLGDGYRESTSEDRSLEFHIPQELTGDLQALAVSENCTLFVTVLSAFQKLLAKHTKQDKFLLAVPSANRNSSGDEMVIDLLAKVLVLPVDVSECSGLEQVRDLILEAQAHPSARTNLVNVMFAFQNTPWKESYQFSDELTATPLVHQNPGSKFHLTLYLRGRQGRLVGSWHYNTGRFTDRYVENLRDSFLALLQTMTSPSASVLKSENQEQANSKVYPEFLTRWRRQVENQAESIALISGNTQFSYGEINEESEQLAEYLKSQGLKPGELVALDVPRCKSFLIGILALWKVGAAYLALDTAQSQDRKQLLLKTADVAAILSESEGKPNLERRSSEENIRPDLAYAMMTSGSTGIPKAVAIGQSNLSFYAQSLGSELDLTAQDVYLHTAPLTFSSSVRQFVIPWSYGATLVLADEDQRRNPERLLELAQREAVTVIDLVPSFWGATLDLWTGAKLEHVRLLLSASEGMPRNLADRCLELAPKATFVNMYGQTETTGILAIYPYRSKEAPHTDFLPLGRALPGNRVVILDCAGGSVPNGVWGEIAVSGAGLGLGYLAGETLSALYRTGDMGRIDSRGQLQFGGRLDSQMKVRGHRLEPGDIEYHLAQHPAIQEVAVRCEAGRMTARVVGELTLGELRPWLDQRLPTYMHPSKLELVSSLARTDSGKIKRDFSEVESQLLDIWKDVLKLEDISVSDNFFNLGGDSLLTLQVVAKARSLGWKIELKDLFEFQTIDQLSQHLQSQASPQAAAMVRVPQEELRRLSTTILREAGLHEEGIRRLTEVQLESSLRGQPTHNIGDIPRYAARLKKGVLNGNPAIQVVQETAFSALVDGDNGPGQWVATAAIELAIKKAEKSGLGMVCCKKSNHYGAAGHYAWLAAKAGMVGLCTTNGPVLLAPTGGVTPLFGNNPIAFGVPNEQGLPMVLDMALSVAPRGKIGLALRQGQDLAKDWILDALGRPSTELADLAAGLGVPIGAHKGYGLALAMEILAGVMSGSGYASDHSRATLKTEKANIGHFFLVIKPELFMPGADFQVRVADLFEQIKMSEKAQGCTEILIPGELELRAREENLKLGVPVRECVYQTLLAAAKPCKN